MYIYICIYIYMYIYIYIYYVERPSHSDQHRFRSLRKLTTTTSGQRSNRFERLQRIVSRENHLRILLLTNVVSSILNHTLFTPWSTNMAMENHHFQWVNPRNQWPFSIAMLNYQRVHLFTVFDHVEGTAFSQLHRR